MSDEVTVPGVGPGQTDPTRVKSASYPLGPVHHGGPLHHGGPNIEPFCDNQSDNLVSGIHLLSADEIDFAQLTPVSLASLDKDGRAGLMADLTRRLASAPLNLTPILTLLLAACGRHVEDASLTQPPAAGSATSAPPAIPELIPVRGDNGAQGLHVSTLGSVSRPDPPELSPEAKENILRRCLQAITDNELQPSAIHELCGLIDLDTVDRSHDVLWRWRTG